MSILLLLSFAITAQTAPDAIVDQRRCTGARIDEVCSPQGREALRKASGLDSVENEAAAGVELYRAFFLEGGGRLPVVSFVRRPGQNSSVEVTAYDGRKMTAQVSSAVWEQVRTQALLADKALAPLGTPDDDICMEGGAVLAEIGEPAWGARQPAAIRSRAQSSCAQDNTVQFARSVALLAAETLPACAVIDANRWGDGGIRRLRACFQLSGDQVAAAEVMNRFQGVPSGDAKSSKISWFDLTGVEDGTQLSWNGRTFGARAPENLIDQITAHPNMQMSLITLRGISSREVEAAGVASYTTTTAEGGQWLRAEFKQVWRKYGGAQGWRLMEWRVGAFEEPRR